MGSIVFTVIAKASLCHFFFFFNWGHSCEWAAKSRPPAPPAMLVIIVQQWRWHCSKEQGLSAAHKKPLKSGCQQCYRATGCFFRLNRSVDAAAGFRNCLNDGKVVKKANFTESSVQSGWGKSGEWSQGRDYQNRLLREHQVNLPLKKKKVLV